jgi:hypothetical protein
MSVSKLLPICVLLASLALVTSAVASIVVIITNKQALLAIAVLLEVTAVVLIFLSFFRNNDSTKRWIYLWTALFCLASGITMFFEDDSFRKDSWTLALVIGYGITGISVSTSLSLFYQFFTRCCFSSVFEDRVAPHEEGLVYFSVNVLSGFLVGLVAAFGKRGTQEKALDPTKIGYTVGIWILNVISMALTGCFWGSNSSSLKSLNKRVVLSVSAL